MSTFSDPFGVKNPIVEALERERDKTYKKLEETIQELKRQLEGSQNDLNSKTRTLALTQSSLASTENNLATQKESVRKLEAELEIKINALGAALKENTTMRSQIERLETLASNGQAKIAELQANQAAVAAQHESNAEARKAAVRTLEAAVATDAVLRTNVAVIEKQNEVFGNTLDFSGELNSENVKQTALAEASRAKYAVQTAEAVILGSTVQT